MGRRRLGALLVVLGLALTAVSSSPASAGCGLGSTGPTVRAFRSPTMRSAAVLVYGDSITFSVARRFTALHPEVAVDAWGGRRTLDAAETLARDLVDRPAPRVVVMAMGTNDTHAAGDVGALARHVRTALPASTRLLWLTTYAEPWQGWEEVNAQLTGVPGVELVDWAAVNRGARGTAARSPLLTDGVHLACSGADAWLRLVGEALRA